jgi:hypothetical protein
MRVFIACAAVCIAASPVLAADPKVESAAKVLQSVSADPGKLKTFCEMSKAMDAAGEQATPAVEAKIDGYMKQLGPDFESAWNAGSNVDENSADGKVFNAAVDSLVSKCT